MIEIIFENTDVIAINKPCGVACQLGANLLHSLVDILEGQLKRKIFLIHRLDKETSGIMLVAKNPESANKYALALHNATKIYTAFCFGTLEKKQGKLSYPIIVNGFEKKAETKYFIEKTISLDVEDKKLIISKLKFEIQNGKKHQIRIHSSQKGIPIIGDDKYGNFAYNKIIAKKYKIKKLNLACTELKLPGMLPNLVVEIPSNLERMNKIFDANSAPQIEPLPTVH